MYLFCKYSIGESSILYLSKEKDANFVEELAFQNTKS